MPPLAVVLAVVTQTQAAPPNVPPLLMRAPPGSFSDAQPDSYLQWYSMVTTVVPMPVSGGAGAAVLGSF